MTWEHVRFLALLIPTWVVLGAIAVSLAMPVKGRAGQADAGAQASVATCRDSGERVGLADAYREYPAAAHE